MKKITKMLLSGTAVAALGTAVLTGNGLLASSVLAKENDTNKLVIKQDHPANDTQVKDTGRTIIKNGPNGTFLTVKADGVQPPVVATEQREGFWDEGTPGAQEQTKTQSLAMAKEEVIKKYALRPEVLNKFTITATYHEAGTYIADHIEKGKNVWFIEMQPIHQSDYSEIGTYAVYLDALTGKVIKIFSAADAVG